MKKKKKNGNWENLFQEEQFFTISGESFKNLETISFYIRIHQYQYWCCVKNEIYWLYSI